MVKFNSEQPSSKSKKMRLSAWNGPGFDSAPAINNIMHPNRSQRIQIKNASFRETKPTKHSKLVRWLNPSSFLVYSAKEKNLR